jgi:UDP-3-O-[3-hydroxymyristoyl] glucosamine N-acyltransferase
MKLSTFFDKSELLRDAEVSQTLSPSADKPSSVCYAGNDSVLAAANSNGNIAAILTTRELADQVDRAKGCVICPNPKEAFYRLHNRMFELGELLLHRQHSIDKSAVIDPTAIIGTNVIISRGVLVGPYAIVEDNTVIGEDSLIGPNVVIGGRGLQDSMVDGRNVRVAFAGGVKIGARCEVLTAALIQRPYLSQYTEIADDTKLGPGASVGHGCRIGRAVFVGARSVVAGNAVVGDEVWIGMSSVISDGLTIGARARVQLGSVVIRNVGEGESVSGNFALPHAQHLRLHTRDRHER